MVNQVFGGNVTDDVIEKMHSPITYNFQRVPNCIMISSNKKTVAVAASLFRVDLASTHLVA